MISIETMKHRTEQMLGEEFPLCLLYTSPSPRD